MGRYSFKQKKHCRWCGAEYWATKPRNQDGFHRPACKQAHHRAYKKYVTTKKPARARAPGKRVTPKKRKK